MNRSLALLFEGLSQPQSLAGHTLYDWDGLLRAALMTRTLGRLAALAEGERILSQIPEPVRRHLTGALTFTQSAGNLVRWELWRIARALVGCDATLVLLKAAAYVAADLPAAAGRSAGDVDLLVPRDRLDDVWARFLAAGWECQDYTERDREYFRKWLHEYPPLRHRYRGAVLDLHHNILPFTDPIRVDVAKLFDSAVPAGVAGPFRMLSPRDMVLHGSVHLFRNGDYRKGIRDLSDLDLLVRYFTREAGFWDGFVERVAELRFGQSVYLALRCLTQWFRTPIPNGVLDEVRGRPRLGFTWRWLERMADRALLPDGVERQNLGHRFAGRLLSFYPLPRPSVLASPLFWSKRFPAQTSRPPALR